MQGDLGQTSTSEELRTGGGDTMGRLEEET